MKRRACSATPTGRVSATIFSNEDAEHETDEEVQAVVRERLAFTAVEDMMMCVDS